MAEDKPKLVTEFEIDKGSIKKEFDGLEKEAQKAGLKIGDALSPKDTGGGLLGLGLGAVALNQSLELLGKVKSALVSVADSFIHVVKEAESIKQVNYQFEILSTRALGVGSDLKEAFVEAGAGLVSTDDILKAANESLVELGEQAQKLPEALSLARQASLINGKDIIENFNSIVRAVETGSSKSLRSLNIFVDLDKATKEYARSIGVLPEKLTQVELQQLRLNAVLERGKDAYKGIADVKEATSALTQLSVAFKETSDSIFAAISSKLAPAFKTLAETAAAGLHRFKTDFDAAFSPDDTEKTNAQIEKLTRNIEFLKATIAKPNLNTVFDIPQYRQELKASEIELQNLITLQEKAKAEAKAKAELGAKPEADRAKAEAARLVANPLLRFTPEELAKNQADINAALARGEDEGLAIRISAAQRIQDEKQRNAELDNLDAERQVQAEVDLEAKIASLREQYSLKKGFDQKVLNELIETETANSQAKIEAIEAQGAVRRGAKTRALAEQMRSITVSGLSSTFQDVGARLQAGEGLFDNFGKGIIGIIGDMAIKLGEAILVQAIALESFITAINTLLPGSGAAAAAAGVGLIIFGAALKASVGAGGSSSVGAGVGGGASAGVTEEPGAITALPGETTPQAPKTNVVLNVNGNIIPRDRNFALELSDLVREAFENQGAIAVQS